MAHALAKPGDVLLAYDPGLVTIGYQAHPLELGYLTRGGAALAEMAGTPDTYYEDFTSGLREYVAARGAVGGGGGGRGADPSALVLGIDFLDGDGDLPLGGPGPALPPGGLLAYVVTTAPRGDPDRPPSPAAPLGEYIVETGAAEPPIFEARDAASGRPVGSDDESEGGYGFDPSPPPVFRLGDGYAASDWW